jgi:hypothetical protein
MRDFVVSLCRRGMLASLAEGALIAGVNRRRVMAWLDAAGLECRRSRLAYVAKMRTRAVDQCEGKPTRKAMTQAQRRAMADRANTSLTGRAA